MGFLHKHNKDKRTFGNKSLLTNVSKTNKHLNVTTFIHALMEKSMVLIKPNVRPVWVSVRHAELVVRVTILSEPKLVSDSSTCPCWVTVKCNVASVVYRRSCKYTLYFTITEALDLSLIVPRFLMHKWSARMMVLIIF